MNILPYISRITRDHNFKGMERLLRMIHSPRVENNNCFETVMDYEGGKLQINTCSFLEWATYFKGHYDPMVSKVIKSKISPKSISIDVGANIGIHTIELAKGERVYAFEPNPKIHRRLSENISLSKIDNVEIYKFGLSDKEGNIEFYLPLENGANQGLATIYGDTLSERGEKIEIKLKTIDIFFQNLKRLDIIKIDTEGHDFNVLLGARNTILRLKPIIIFEWSPSWDKAGHDLNHVEKFFSGLDYSLATLDGSQIVRRDYSYEIIASPK